MALEIGKSKFIFCMPLSNLIVHLRKFEDTVINWTVLNSELAYISVRSEIMQSKREYTNVLKKYTLCIYKVYEVYGDKKTDLFFFFFMLNFIQTSG